MFAADLNNEPHGVASWGDGNIATDWRLAAERIGAMVLAANPKLLIFVEGVERNAAEQPADNCWWGGHVAAAAKVRPLQAVCYCFKIMIRLLSQQYSYSYVSIELIKCKPPPDA